jgi:hypothetical protein
MSQENPQRLINNLDEFRQQAIRTVNEAIFTLNNLRGKFYYFKHNL